MFSVELPKAEPEEISAPVLVQPVPVGRLAGICVLCIDNEPSVLLGMKTLISGWGCSVRTAESREQAVEICKAGDWRPDIVLADFHLDKGVGLDAIAAVRDRLGGQVPAVIISADNTPEMQREVRAHGHAFLRKPVKAAALRALMSQLTLARTAAE